MNLITLENKYDVAQFANRWCEEKTLETNAQAIYLPAGNTPIELYKKWEEERPEYLQHQTFIQIDDVISKPAQGIFESFFKEKLPSYQHQFNWIKDNKKMQAEVAILGLGLNGHIAFHEPHLPDNFSYGEVSLSQGTIKHLKLEKDAKGFSYGLGSFLKCQAILLIVTGKKKSHIFKKFLAADSQLPASKLKHHQDITVLCDRSASSPVS